MHLPPAAAWKVGPSKWQRASVVCLVLLVSGGSAFFCLSQRWGASSVLLLLALAACSATAVASLFGSARGHLRWDGARWQWSDPQDHTVTQLVCVLDLQRCLLVYVDGAAGKRLWLWLESPTMDAAWLALRRAVVASRPGLSRSNPRTQPSSLPG
jgi:hypothetical protein